MSLPLTGVRLMVERPNYSFLCMGCSVNGIRLRRGHRTAWCFHFSTGCGHQKLHAGLTSDIVPGGDCV
jgi:hypothetical protein